MAQSRIRPSKIPELLLRFGQTGPAQGIESLTKGITSGIGLANVIAERKRADAESDLKRQELQQKITQAKQEAQAQQQQQEALSKAQQLSTSITPETPATTIPFGPQQQPATLGQVATGEATPEGVDLASVGPQLAAGIEEQRLPRQKEELVKTFPEQAGQRLLSEVLPSAEQQLKAKELEFKISKQAEDVGLKEERNEIAREANKIRSGSVRENAKAKANSILAKLPEEFFDQPGWVSKIFSWAKGEKAGISPTEKVFFNSLLSSAGLTPQDQGTELQNFNSEEEARAAGFSAGDRIMINNEPGTLQ